MLKSDIVLGSSAIFTAAMLLIILPVLNEIFLVLPSDFKLSFRRSLFTDSFPAWDPFVLLNKFVGELNDSFNKWIAFVGRLLPPTSTLLLNFSLNTSLLIEEFKILDRLCDLRVGWGKSGLFDSAETLFLSTSRELGIFGIGKTVLPWDWRIFISGGYTLELSSKIS